MNSKKLTRQLIPLTLLALTFSSLPVGPSVERAFASTGALTIATGGDTSPTSNWSYNSGTGLLSVTGTATIAPSYLAGVLDQRHLVIEALSIAVNDNLEATTGNYDLDLKASGNIIVANGVSIQTRGGGDIIIQSDTDENLSGSIRLGGHTHASGRGSVISNGGDIYLSGGTNPLTGFAYGTTDVSPPSGSNTRASAGVAVYGFELNAGGGNILIRGIGTTSLSTRGVMLETNASTPGNTTLSTSGSGTVTVVGKANSSASGVITNPWGINISGCEISTSAGDILLQGETVQQGTSTNKRGIAAGGLTATSTTGDILIEDRSPTSVVNFTGLYFNTVNLTAPGGEVAIRSDRYYADGTTTLQTPRATIFPYNPGASFRASITNLGTIDGNEPVTGTSIELIVGLEESNAGVTVNGVIDVEGPVTINGGTVSVNNSLSASEEIEINTWTGNLSLARAVTSRLASGDSVMLFADKPEAVDQVGDGDIVVSGTGAVNVESGARALLYSGTKAASTGLEALVGGQSNSRTRVAATTTLGSLSPTISSTGKYALFRVGDAQTTTTPTTTTPTTTTPASTAMLAATGANVEWLMVAGFLVAVAGSGFLAFSRRKRIW